MAADPANLPLFARLLGRRRRFSVASCCSLPGQVVYREVYGSRILDYEEKRDKRYALSFGEHSKNVWLGFVRKTPHGRLSRRGVELYVRCWTRRLALLNQNDRLAPLDFFLFTTANGQI